MAISAGSTVVTSSPEPRLGKPGAARPVFTPRTARPKRWATARTAESTDSSFCPTRTITVPLATSAPSMRLGLRSTAAR